VLRLILGPIECDGCMRLGHALYGRRRQRRSTRRRDGEAGHKEKAQGTAPCLAMTTGIAGGFVSSITIRKWTALSHFLSSSHVPFFGQTLAMEGRLTSAGRRIWFNQSARDRSYFGPCFRRQSTKPHMAAPQFESFGWIWLALLPFHVVARTG
jgi:hypothetical protein